MLFNDFKKSASLNGSSSNSSELLLILIWDHIFSTTSSFGSPGEQRVHFFGSPFSVSGFNLLEMGSRNDFPYRLHESVVSNARYARSWETVCPVLLGGTVIFRSELTRSIPDMNFKHPSPCFWTRKIRFSNLDRRIISVWEWEWVSYFRLIALSNW